MIKVCGMTEAENVRSVEALGVDMMGFIFYDRSPRCCRQVPDYLPSCCRVGVFVNPSLEYILEKDKDFHFDYIQLHGSESPAFCAQVKACGFRVIKAFSMKDASDLARCVDYDGCDLFVFDTKTPLVGGCGVSFDWSILEAYKGDVPFLLSGGIGPDSVEALAGFSHPMLAGYDLNSRFEISPGLKDAGLLGEFINVVLKDRTII